MDEIKKLTNKDFDQLYKLRRICFTVLTKKQEDFAKVHYYDEKNWYGVFIKNQLVAAIWIKPLIVNFNGHMVKSGGIGSVLTHPDFRYKGYSKKLINYCINEMKKRKYIISSLSPFLQSFYKKFGYTHTTDIKQITYSFNKLKHFQKNVQLEDITLKDIDKIINIKNLYISKYQLFAYRDEKYTKENIQMYEMKDYKVKTYKSEGYIVYKEDDDSIKIVDLIYNNINTLENLLSYICNTYNNKEKLIIISPNDNIIIDYINTEYIECKILQNKMTTILNVKKALELTKFNSNFVIKVENEKFYIENNKVTKTNNKEDIEFNIKDFTAYILGYNTIEQLVILNKVKIVDNINIELDKKEIYENEVY